MINRFFTVEDNIIESEIIEKKSRFIAKVIRVNSEEEANEKIAEIKKIHRDARHNVFAYRIANGVERFSDDGEPSGTAGVPILNILRGEKLENVLVVVTRYFGGILLGTGGLVKAYSNSCALGLEKAGLVEKYIAQVYRIEISYTDIDKFKYFPKFIIKFIVMILRLLDNHDMLPSSLTKGSIYHSTVLLSNLGSIHCDGIYHNLTNFGTNSIVVTIGEIKEVVKLEESKGETAGEFIEIGNNKDLTQSVEVLPQTGSDNSFILFCTVIFLIIGVCSLKKYKTL